MADWNSWYHKNSGDFNEARRKNYASDPEKQQKARVAAKAYRARVKSGHSVSRTLTREVSGKPVEVLSSGVIADDIGCSRQMLINWEKRGWIPQPTFSDKHRLYTTDQADLIKTLALRVRQAKRLGTKGLESRLKSTVEFIHSNWSA